MSVQVVNGYVCFNCADVALAKKDIDPAHPPGSPSNPTGSASQGPSASSTAPASASTSAVVFGGALAQVGAPEQTQSGSSPQQPPAYQPGANVSTLA